jgi:hypothetical protein
MQCLYCSKRLGLFASRKRPFCSESHQVAYQYQLSVAAMRRVLDPIYADPPPRKQLLDEDVPGTVPCAPKVLT